jgi:hypothetical protein
MIIALLFLILFAILFPGALRFLFVLIFIGAIMAIGAVHAESAGRMNLISIWHSVNDVCHSDSREADRACNQITVIETMMKDNGCRIQHKRWLCPHSD